MTKTLRTREAIALLVGVAVPLLIGGSPAESRELPIGPWHGWVAESGTPVEFDMEITVSGDDFTTRFLNGENVETVSETTWDGESLVLEFLDYDSRVVATLDDTGRRLDGLWHRNFGGAGVVSVPFHATAGDAPRFEIETIAESPMPIDGRWLIDFEQRDHVSVGLFETQSDGNVHGTIMTSTGDYRHLAGIYRGGRLLLSRFDGFHAFLFDATIHDDGKLRGSFTGVTMLPDSGTGYRDPDAELYDPFGHFEIVGPVDLDELVVFDLEQKPCTISEVANGRILIIEILGTWCPNCHDATVFLKELYKRYGDRGLSVAGIAFEVTSDFDRNTRFVRRYREKHAVPYPVLLAFSDVRLSPSQVFPNIEGPFAFPTILILGGDGTVHGVHVGFTGPATGDEYVKLRTRFEVVIERLLGDTEAGR